MCFRKPGYYIRHQVRTQRVKLPNGIEVQNPNIMHCCCDPWWEWPQRQTRALLVRTDDFWYEWEAAACGICPRSQHKKVGEHLETRDCECEQQKRRREKNRRTETTKNPRSKRVKQPRCGNALQKKLELLSRSFQVFDHVSSFASTHQARLRARRVLHPFL